MKKARGSAIIIAMLMIAAIGGIAFSIGRLLFIETISASYYENGSVAYYAAESGLEEGFLRYRYNRNAEVPFNNWVLNAPNNNTVFRSSLGDKTSNTGNGSTAGIAKTDLIAEPAKQFFDLRMGYLGTEGSPWFGTKDTNGSGLERTDFPLYSSSGEYKKSPGYIQKDEAVKIDLTGLNIGGTNNLTLHAKYYSTALNGPPIFLRTMQCRALMEIKIIVEQFGGHLKEYKSLMRMDPTCSPAMSDLIIPTQINSSETNTLYMYLNRLQDVIDIQNRGALPTSTDQKVTLFLKPLYYDAIVGITSSTCSSGMGACDGTKSTVVAGPNTVVESTGYFGSTTRKLVANIDRQSGTIYDLFDYVIYKAE